jgi:hypothetical protein
LSQEAEIRLDKSFEHQDLLPGVLSLAFGPEVAALAIGIAALMSTVGREAASPNFASKGTQDWIDNPYAFQQAVDAAQLFLEKVRPKGKVVPPSFEFVRSHFHLRGDVIGHLEKYERERASKHVKALVSAIIGRSDKKTYKEDAARIRVVSADLVKRLSLNPEEN